MNSENKSEINNPQEHGVSIQYLLLNQSQYALEFVEPWMGVDEKGDATYVPVVVRIGIKGAISHQRAGYAVIKKKYPANSEMRTKIDSMTEEDYLSEFIICRSAAIVKSNENLSPSNIPQPELVQPERSKEDQRTGDGNDRPNTQPGCQRLPESETGPAN